MYTLHCLGEATLRDPSGNLIHFRSRKHLALLIYLALNSERAHRRERLAWLLWNGSEDSKARHSLSQALYAVRRLLNDTVRIEGNDLELSTEELWVDATEMERRVNAGDAVGATDLYKGEFLEGFWVPGAKHFEEWVEHERSSVCALARQALRRRIKSSRNSHDWIDVRTQAGRLVKLDPFDEAAYGELMRALWMLGDRMGAIECYDSLKEVLAEELEAEPSEEIEGLICRIKKRPVRGGWNNSVCLREAGTQVQFREPPFVGRKRELATLTELWDYVVAGESRALCLCGEAGIGKTRLAEELIGGLGLENLIVLRGRCYEAEQSTPYGAIADAFRGSLKELPIGGVEPLWLAELARIVPRVSELCTEIPMPPPLEGDSGRIRLHEGIAQVLRAVCDAQPTLLFIDDLHWADESSISLLHYILRRVSNGLYTLAAYRPEELKTEEDRGPRLLHELPGTSVLDVGPLADLESSRLLRSLLGEGVDEQAVSDLQVKSEGNPFFAIELAQATKSNPTSTSETLIVPDSVRTLLERRILTLNEEMLALVEQAAVMGTRSAVDTIETSVDLSPSAFRVALKRLVQAGLLTVNGGLVCFRHDLIREVVLERIPTPRRKTLHLRAARALIRTDGDVGETAFHLSKADEGREAYAYAIRGARAAERVFALDETVRLLQLAAQHAPTEVASTRLMGELGRLYWRMRRYEEARALLEKRSTQVSQSSSTQSTRIECECDLLLLDIERGTINPQESAQTLRTFYLKTLQTHDAATGLHAEILQKLVWATARSGKADAALEAVEWLCALYAESTDDAARVRAARTIAIHNCYLGNLQTAESLIREALDYAVRNGDQLAALECYNAMTVLASRSIDQRLLTEILEYGLPLASRCGDPARKSRLLSNCATSFIYLHETDKAEELLRQAREALQLAGDFPDTSPSIEYNRGHVAFQRRHRGEAANMWKRAYEAATNAGLPSVQSECIAALGTLDFLRRDLPKARTKLAQATRLARRVGSYEDDRTTLEWLRAHIYLAEGKEGKAQEVLSGRSGWARDRDTPLYLTCLLALIKIADRHGGEERSETLREELKQRATDVNAEWHLRQAGLR